MLDFQKRVIITVNGRRISSGDRMVEPDLHTHAWKTSAPAAIASIRSGPASTCPPDAGKEGIRD